MIHITSSPLSIAHFDKIEIGAQPDNDSIPTHFCDILNSCGTACKNWWVDIWNLETEKVWEFLVGTHSHPEWVLQAPTGWVIREGRPFQIDLEILTEKQNVGCGKNESVSVVWVLIQTNSHRHQSGLLGLITSHCRGQHETAKWSEVLLAGQRPNYSTTELSHVV